MGNGIDHDIQILQPQGVVTVRCGNESSDPSGNGKGLRKAFRGL